MLYQVIDGWPKVSYFTEPSLWDNAQTLLARGLIRRRGGEFVPTADVLFSLRLDA